MFDAIDRRFRIVIGLLFLLLPNAVLADTGFIDRQVTIKGTAYRYQVYVPANFNVKKKWPVILFLHDNGGRGVDGRSQTNAGLASVIRRDRVRVPAIVVFPQAHPGSRWSNPAMQEQVLACLDATAKEFNGDTDRFYLMGYSMGGQGALRLASRWPDRFAALVDISGTVIAKSPSATNEQVTLDVQTHPFLNTSDIYGALAQLIRAIPIWVFHADADASVPVEQSRQLVSALKSAGATVRYTEYSGADHSIEERALSEPELLRWLLSQTRKHRAAALVPSQDHVVHGVVFSLTHDELDRLYADPSVNMYRPEAVPAKLADGNAVPCLTFNLPAVNPNEQRNRAYAEKLRALAADLNLPPSYVETI